MAGLDLALLCCFEALLLAAAATDVRSYRIPNLIPLAMLAAFTMWLFAGGARTGLTGAAVALAIAFLFGLLLWHFGVWGGGDAKLLAAMAPWVGLAGLPRLVAIMAVAGGILAVGFLIWGRLAGPSRPAPRHLPYGVAIAVAGTDWFLAATGVKKTFLSLGPSLISFG